MLRGVQLRSRKFARRPEPLRLSLVVCLLCSAASLSAWCPALRAQTPAWTSSTVTFATVPNQASEPHDDVSPAVNLDFGSRASFLPQDAAASSERENWLRRWLRTSDRARASQPHYTSPLISTNALLTQQFRYDMNWQSSSTGVLTSNYGSGKGLEVIPNTRMEVQIGVPPYVVHETKTRDGFGDLPVLVKFRLFSAPENKSFYFVGAFMGASFPSGSSANSTGHTVLTPTIAVAKGWGHFDVQNTVSFSLPVTGANIVGRAILLNNTFQYNCGHQVWSEVEVNSTFFTAGPSSGKKQTFLTPGIILGNFKVADGIHLKFGVGIQLPVTHFHAYKHREIFSVRFPF